MSTRIDKSKQLIVELRTLLVDNKVTVSEIEMTTGNYDEKGNLISQEIPTITTDLCEIGIYPGICYFTIILQSLLFTKELFNLISAYPGSHIYGFKSFLEDYYPKNNFYFNDLIKQAHSENYMQVQFNFRLKNVSLLGIVGKYFEIESIFEKTDTKIVNQLTENFT